MIINRIMRTLIILLLCTNTSFAIAQISPKAVEKNNQSVKTAGFFNDSDSLNKAIHLSDEAIALEPSYKLAYANKIKYLMALGQKEKALQTKLQMEKFSPKRMLKRAWLWILTNKLPLFSKNA